MEYEEHQFIELITKFQMLTEDWCASKPTFLNSQSVVFPAGYETILKDIESSIDKVMTITSNGNPYANFELFDRMKRSIPKLKLYPLEQDRSGWLIGCLQVNNIKISFG